MHKTPLRQLIKMLHSKTISSLELTEHYLKRIHQAKSLNAFVYVDEENALSEAKLADVAIQKGDIKPLTGLPIAHKDIFCTASMPTTCGSKMLANFKPPFNATVVEKLDNAGSILLGKTNMDEFAMGSSNENSYFGPVKNPWNLDYVAGGSSGGSAAAIAADLVPFVTGSDTGGSIRQPAAFCGISGLKPTYGMASRFGMIAYASSLDQAGPMAHSVDDLALILSLMVGVDPRDSTSVNQKHPNYSKILNQPLHSLRIGLPSCFFSDDVDPEIQQAIRQAIVFFESCGAQIIDINLALQPFWVPCYYVISCAEASSNLSRYDGIRFGYRAVEAKSIEELMRRSRSEGFGMEVKRRILSGVSILSSEHYHDGYIQAQKIRRLIQNELLEAFSTVDIILGPTTPTCAFKIGEKITNPTQRYLSDVFTVAANLAGLPALSIPVGFNQGLPIGMQLMGSPFSEATLLSVAHTFQQATDWHMPKPDFNLLRNL